MYPSGGAEGVEETKKRYKAAAATGRSNSGSRNFPEVLVFLEEVLLGKREEMQAKKQ